MSEGASEGSGSGYTLVVGPDGDDRAWIEGTLLRGGLSVAASTEADLLVRNDIEPPHLLILDDSATRDERLATLRRLQAHPSLQGVPVAILAYDSDIDSFSSAITKGAAAYLVKPVSPEELVSVAHRLTDWSCTTDRTERRHRLRRPLLMKVDVDLRARKLRVPGQLLEVSRSGCRIELSEEVQEGDLIRVILRGPDDSTHVALGAEVRWHRVAEDGTHSAGLRFTGSTALLAAKLLGFVSSGQT